MKKKEKYKVKVNLESITLNITGDITDEKGFQDLIKETFIKQITSQFPCYKYSINSANVLTKEEVIIGKIVKDKKEGIYCIITEINPKTINVAYPNAVVAYGVPECWITTDIKEEELDGIVKLFNRPTFQLNEVDLNSEEDKIISSSDLREWREGCTGYIVVKNNVIPVILGKSSRNKYKFYQVNGKENKYYCLSESQLKLVYDTREQAEKRIKL